jgi:hypothetical protein
MEMAVPGESLHGADCLPGLVRSRLRKLGTAISSHMENQ